MALTEFQGNFRDDGARCSKETLATIGKLQWFRCRAQKCAKVTKGGPEATCLLRFRSLGWAISGTGTTQEVFHRRVQTEAQVGNVLEMFCSPGLPPHLVLSDLQQEQDN